MVKRGALSNVEKFFIEGNAELPVEDIAKELDRSVKIVQKHLNSVDTKPKPKPEPEPVNPESRFLQNMGRHERAGEKVATVMTKSASEEADRTRPQRLVNRKLQDAIHKPRKQ
jgi:hypothetical protein